MMSSAPKKLPFMSAALLTRTVTNSQAAITLEAAAALTSKRPMSDSQTLVRRTNICNMAAAAVSPSLFPQQIRGAHSDIPVPDFSAYRRKGTQMEHASSEPSYDGRRAFTYAMAGLGSIAGVYGTKVLVNEFVSSMAASADVLALAKAEIKLADIPLGKNVTFKWRGMPLFVKHRTPEEIADAESTDISKLRHPQPDSERVKDKEWLVVLGICTHLGCVPIGNQGDYLGGYYCPCHGSHYDCAGRIRKGPAPFNLEVPEHEFPEPGLLVVGSAPA